MIASFACAPGIWEDVGVYKSDLRAAAPAADPGKRGKEEGPRATVE